MLKLTKDVLTLKDEKVILPFTVLSTCVELDCTILDLFNFVEKHPELMEFISQYSLCKNIELFHREARQPDPDLDLKELVISWYTGLDETVSTTKNLSGLKTDNTYHCT